MILEVENATTKDRKNKPTQYVVTLKGVDNNGVEATLSLKSDMKSDIEKYVPLRSGERRRMDIELLDHTLSEYDEMEEDEHHKAVLEHDRMMQRRREAAAAGSE